MDTFLIGTLIRFSTSRQVWEAIATTYFDGNDTFQVYYLCRRVSQLRQRGGSLEKYYNDLQGLWRDIDFRQPNPIECANDIQKFNSLIQEEDSQDVLQIRKMFYRWAHLWWLRRHIPMCNTKQLD